MLMQPTLEKLYSMKLMGMAEAIRRQMENPETAQLSFEERLAMLVDQQWDWRQNKALTRRMKNARFKLGSDDRRHRLPPSAPFGSPTDPQPGGLRLGHAA